MAWNREITHRCLSYIHRYKYYTQKVCDFGLNIMCKNFNIVLFRIRFNRHCIYLRHINSFCQTIILSRNLYISLMFVIHCITFKVDKSSENRKCRLYKLFLIINTISSRSTRDTCNSSDIIS